MQWVLENLRHTSRWFCLKAAQVLQNLKSQCIIRPCWSLPDKYRWAAFLLAKPRGTGHAESALQPEFSPETNEKTPAGVGGRGGGPKHPLSQPWRPTSRYPNNSIRLASGLLGIVSETIVACALPAFQPRAPSAGEKQHASGPQGLRAEGPASRHRFRRLGMLSS